VSESVTYVVRLTPPGRGAVASLCVAGPMASAHVDRLFHSSSGRPLRHRAERRIALGRWLDAEQGEQLVVCRRSDEKIEMHCHGGEAAVAAIQQSLLQVGCRQLPWQDWVALQAPDSIRAEAAIALAGALTEATAAILLDQYEGALSRELAELGDCLAAGESGAARERVARLLRSAPLGLHLTRRWQVVLAGQPNVGKSSLLNRLLGFERAIVFDQPGTTRDAVSGFTAIGRWPVELSDTAGLRQASGDIETEGVRRATQRLAEADLALLVFDSTQTWSAADEELCRLRPDGLIVHNKSDLPQAQDNRPAGICVSATTGAGLTDLVERIARRLAPTVPTPGSPIPFTLRQIEALQAVKQSLAGGDLHQAIATVQRLTERTQNTSSSCWKGPTQ